MRCLADEDKSPEVSSLLETAQATAALHRPRVGEPTRTNITRQKKVSGNFMSAAKTFSSFLSSAV